MRILISIGLFVCSMNSFSCGTLAQRLLSYPHSQDESEKTEFLKGISCGEADSYVPKMADPIIATVLVDALNSGVDRALIFNKLKSYNCVYSARNTNIYSELKEIVTEDVLEELCPMDYLKSLSIINAKSGVNMREGPSSKSAKLANVSNGTYVQVLDDDGEWVRVKNYRGIGYIYKQFLNEY